MNRRVFSVFSLAILITGCESTSTRVRSYSDPAVGNRVIASLAILPVRNAPIAQSESIRMNREITQTVQRQNPNLRIVGPVESIQALNAKNLVADYDNYLVGLAQSGIPNSEVLHRVGEALGVDAIMQGQIVGLYQEDGSYPGRPGRTKFALRYSIVSTQDALLMWETSAEVNRRTGTVFEQAPALELVLPDATQIVLKSIPKFAFVKAGQ